MDNIRKALAELVTLHLDESPRQPGDDADTWANAWAAARAALAEQPNVREPLTEMQVIAAWDFVKRKLHGCTTTDAIFLARAIERAHGIATKD